MPTFCDFQLGHGHIIWLCVCLVTSAAETDEPILHCLNADVQTQNRHTIL